MICTIKSNLAYPSSKELLKKLVINGFTTHKLLKYRELGVPPSQIKSLLLTNNLISIDVDHYIEKWNKADKMNDIRRYIYLSTKGKEYQNEKLKDLQIRKILFELIKDKPGTIEGRIGAYILDSGSFAQDIFVQIIYLYRDLHLFDNDPSSILSFNKMHRASIDKKLKLIKKQSSLDHEKYLEQLNIRLKFTNKAIDSTRCVIKQVTYELMKEIEESLKQIENANPPNQNSTNIFNKKHQTKPFTLKIWEWNK